MNPGEMATGRAPVVNEVDLARASLREAQRQLLRMRSVLQSIMVLETGPEATLDTQEAQGAR